MPDVITPQIYAEYFRCFNDQASIHAYCEDYRAGATIDLVHDEADLSRKIACPTLVITTEESGLGTVEETRAWQQQIADSELLVLPGNSTKLIAELYE